MRTSPLLQKVDAVTIRSAGGRVISAPADVTGLAREPGRASGADHR